MIRALALAVAVAMAGCGNAQAILAKSTATAAVFVNTARDALDVYDAGKVDDIRAIIKSGTGDEAEKAMKKYLPKYKAARAALGVAAATVETALNAYDAMKLVGAKSKDLIQWIGLLTKAVADVIAACAEVGLKLPGVSL